MALVRVPELFAYAGNSGALQELQPFEKLSEKSLSSLCDFARRWPQICASQYASLTAADTGAYWCRGATTSSPRLGVQDDGYGGVKVQKPMSRPHADAPPISSCSGVLYRPCAAHIPQWGLRTCCPSALCSAFLVGGMGHEVLPSACSSLGLPGVPGASCLLWPGSSTLPPWEGCCQPPSEDLCPRC